MKSMRSFLTVLGTAALCSVLTLAVGAESYDIGQGDIRISASGEGQTVTYLGKTAADDNPVVTGSTKQYSVCLEPGAGQRLNVTLSDLEIDLSACDDAAPVCLMGQGSAIVRLSGTNSLSGGKMNAGLEVRNGALYLSSDGEEAGVLNVSGGQFGAGIGGGAHGDGCDISILSGSINAVGGVFGAGIGGGQNGDGCRIAILGGDVSARGGVKAAGIGGGWCGSGSAITLTGGRTTAFGVCAVGSGDAGAESANIDLTPTDADLVLSTTEESQTTVSVGESAQLPGMPLLIVEKAPEAETVAPEQIQPTEETAQSTEAENTEETTEPSATESAEETTAPTVAENTEETTKPAAAEESEETTQAATESTEEAAKPAATEKPEETTEPAAAEGTEETTGAAATEATEEAAEAAEEDLCSETMSVTDKKGNSYDFTLKRKGYSLRIISVKEAAEFHCTVKDLEDLKAKGISLFILDFGGGNVRASMESIQKVLGDAEDVTIRIGSFNKPSLIRNGKFIALYG